MQKKRNITLMITAGIITLAGVILAMIYLDYRLMIGFILMGIGGVIAAVTLRQEILITPTYKRDGMDMAKDEQLKNYMDGGSHRRSW